MDSNEPDVSASMPYIAARAGDNLLLRRWAGCWIDLVVAAGCLLLQVHRPVRTVPAG